MVVLNEKYILLTTFRRDGTPVKTPVWMVPLDGGAIGFCTSSQSGKAKRIAHTARVLFQPSDSRGRVKAGSVPVDGLARMVTGTEFEGIRQQVDAKYGFMVTVSKAMGTIVGTLRRRRIPYGDIGVILTPA